MCAYGAINGVNDCSNPTLYAALRSWNFPGFVRSDLEAVKNPDEAFKAGLDLIKPDTPAAIVDLVNDGHLSTALLNEAVSRVLIEMFRFHLIGCRTPRSRRGQGCHHATCQVRPPRCGAIHRVVEECQEHPPARAAP